MNTNKSRSELLDNFRKDCDTISDPIVKANLFYEQLAVEWVTRSHYNFNFFLWGESNQFSYNKLGGYDEVLPITLGIMDKIRWERWNAPETF